MLKDLSLCEYFSLQFDESLDVMDTAQLAVFVRMAFQDFTTKEDFLTLLHLKHRDSIAYSRRYWMSSSPHMETCFSMLMYGG